MMKTGDATVDAISKLHFTGNIIPFQWFKEITYENGKPDMLGILLLAEIVYWYRSTNERDEQTGEVIGAKKKFAADMMQRSYNDFAEQFSVTKQQVKRAMDRLEEQQLIEREFRHVTKNGMLFSNVLFVRPLAENVQVITYGEESIDEKTPDQQEEPSSYHEKQDPPSVPDKTNTETTTEITTERKKEKKETDDEVNPVRFFEENGFGMVNSYFAQQMAYWHEKFEEPNHILVEAMIESLIRGVRMFNYVERILVNWHEAGVRTLADAKAEKRRFQSEKQRKERRQGGKPTTSDPKGDRRHPGVKETVARRKSLMQARDKEGNDT